MVEEVIDSEHNRLATRDSGDNYGVDPGINEAKDWATNPIDCTRAKSAIQEAERISGQRFPGPSGDNIQDADRHCIWQALTTVRSHADLARRIAQAHERDRPGPPRSTHMARTSNRTGRDVVLRHENHKSGAVNECHAAADNGRLVII
ncbi:DUF6973 domain-containing protein [Corynebacterium bovis]|uniref:DUF6973 domain-containing protein n=1 Tax=Corynebacterium bovis TaxID=36808 RepID=UPI003B976FA6